MLFYWQFALFHSINKSYRRRVIDNFITSSVLEKMAEFKLSIFPVKIAYENDIIINIGHTIFNIKSPKKFYSFILKLFQFLLTKIIIYGILFIGFIRHHYNFTYNILL